MKRSSSFVVLLAAVAVAVTLRPSLAVAQRVDGTAVTVPALKAESTELTRLRELLIPSALTSWRIRNDATPENIRRFAASLQADGTFSDLKSEAREQAFRRLWILSAAYINGPEVKANRELKIHIYRGFVSWSRLEAANPSPFTAGAFSIPTSFLSAWLCLYHDIQQDLQDPTLRPLVGDLLEIGGRVAAQAWNYPDYSSDKFRSKNPLDPREFREGEHFIVANFLPYRPVLEYAVFVGDERYLDLIADTAKLSFKALADPSDPSKGCWLTGLNPDHTIDAHGPQSYPFGYGRDYLNGFLELAKYFEGGPRRFSKAEYDVIADSILDGIRWHLYRGQEEYSVLGRHDLYPDSGEGGNMLVRNLITKLLDTAGPELSRREELEAEAIRLQEGTKEIVGSRYFWNTEDYVHRGDGFSVFVNMNSTRTAGPENAKPGAVQNYHFGDGVTMMYREGTEYRPTRGAMRFRALPGITAEFSDQPPPDTRTWEGFRGTSDFAGGVSDGSSGACAFVSALKGSPSTANKAYFFDRNIMVALGSDIATVAEVRNPIQTTLNQTAWSTPVKILAGHHPTELALGERYSGQIATTSQVGVWQDGISYVVPPGQNLSLDLEVRKTDWLALADANLGKPAPAETPVFRCFIDHRAAANGWYSYAVLLNSTFQEMSQAMESPPWKVLANTTILQAVEFSEDGLVQAVFRSAGAVVTNDGTRLEVDRPMIVMLRKAGDGRFHLTYQDPLHQKQTSEAKLTLHHDKKNWEYSLKLPQGINLGAPVQRVIPDNLNR